MVNEDVLDTVEPEAAGAANDDQENQVQDDHDQGEPNQEEPNQEKQQENAQALVRRSHRVLKPSTKYPSSQYILLTSDGDNPYCKYIMLTSDGEPECFEEAKTHADGDKWILAMKSEMESLLKNGTYELVEFPKGRKALKINGCSS